MRTTIIKAISTISTLLFFSVLLTSCGLNESHPEYLIESARDNGFVASYRAYFAIENNNIKKISKGKYEKYIYKDRYDNYKIVPKDFYSFKVNAETKDPAEWEYESQYSVDKIYDTDVLIAQLKTMGISFEGRVDIEIIEFDDYYLIGVTSIDEDNTITDFRYAVFHNNKKLSMEQNLDLSDIRDIYKFN